MRCFLLACLLVLGGCAVLSPASTKGCTGPLRPANPNGSVLLAQASPPAASAAAPAASGACR